MFEVIRACLGGSAEDDEVNDDREVELLSVSRLRLDPHLPLSLSLPLPLPLPLLLVYLPT